MRFQEFDSHASNHSAHPRSSGGAPRLPSGALRAFTPAELSAFGLAPPEELAGRYIRVGEPGAQFWYHPFDVEAAQSPSAHGAPNEGALYGFRPLLYPWPPAALLFGSFAAAILSSANTA